jgi:cysteine desulfurase/selenocysteine lyase
MSTADYAKHAYSVPGGDHDVLLTRLVNEITRTPAGGTGPAPNFADPAAGGIGLSPGALTTSAPGPISEPTPVQSAIPSGAPPDPSAGHVLAGTAPKPSLAGPSVGGAGVSPGVAHALPGFGVPGLAEPQPAAVSSKPADEPLDDLVAQALLGSVYGGPSLGGLGASPGIATTSGAPAAGPTRAPYGEVASFHVDPLGLDNPGDGGLQSLLVHDVPRSNAGDGSPASTTAPGSSFYYVENEAPSGAHQSGVPRSGKAPIGGSKVDDRATRRLDRKSDRDPTFASAHPPFDINAIRRDFPILSEKMNGKPLIWFDNAATTQKPKAVIDRLSYFYEHENSNIHRAAHELAARATDAYEDAREAVRRFLNAPSTDSIVFARGTTEAINLVAQSWGRQHIGPGDEIIITHLEHHANIVPWQLLCWEKGAKIRVAPVDDLGQVRLDEYQKLFNSRTRLVSFTHVSNALGTVTPAKDMIEIARRYNVKVLLDGAQSVSHKKVDVQELDPDFFVFSGHKIFGPTGIGALYGKPEVLNAMQPWQGGGNMIADVTFERTLFQPAPLRFEAGTGNIADAVGLAAALEYVERIGLDKIDAYEHSLVEYATHHLSPIPGLTIVGQAKEKASVVSFVLDGYKSEEIGAALNAEGIAVRSGHHCAQPILRRFGHETTVRPSFAFYNTFDEIDVLVDAVKKLATAR